MILAWLAWERVQGTTAYVFFFFLAWCAENVNDMC
jgi:hypothetical protein